MAKFENKQQFVCGQCADQFVRPIKCGAKPRYCSNACKQKAHRLGFRLRYPDGYTPPCRVAPRQPKPCLHCGMTTTRPRFCSVRCSAIARDRRNGVAEFIPEDRVCDECGSVYRNGALVQRYCGEPCRKRVSDRKRNHLRRVLTKGDEAESFDPLEVLARDGWRCHICGVKTPKRLRGTTDLRAPELDHIIPLALGGEHSRKNTACSCRRCNLVKGSKPLGQLRLVA